ncbi:MAG: hypothetical protein ACE5HE_14815, partial [Phycisphaerae bacterium]
ARRYSVGEPSKAWCCDLSQLTDDQLKRRALLEEWLQVGTAEIVECPTGFAFWLDPTCHIAAHVTEFVALESLCCPFLEFEERASEQHDGPVLEIGGSEEARRFVANHFGIRGRAG